jgi:hypothetical protein
MSRTQSILWTSGWDSTFQLVRSLVTGTAHLQPIYLLDENRASTAMELQAMKRIKQKVRADFPARAGLLLPVQFVAVSDLEENEKVSSAFAAVRKRKRIGIQYEWLGRFCYQFGISDLELCIHRDDRAHDALQHVVAVKEGAPETYRVSEKFAGTPEYDLFKPYSFPVFDLTKLQMRAIAEELGLGAIMDLTWFCQAPKNGKPCGVCNPCRFTIDEGLGSRVSSFRRLKGTLYWTARRFARPA